MQTSLVNSLLTQGSPRVRAFIRSVIKDNNQLSHPEALIHLGVTERRGSRDDPRKKEEGQNREKPRNRFDLHGDLFPCNSRLDGWPEQPLSLCITVPLIII